MYRGKFAFQNRLSWLVVGRKFAIFALFCFVFEGKFQVQAPRRAYIRRGGLTEGFLRYEFGGAYIWRGLYMEGLIFGILRYLTMQLELHYLLNVHYDFTNFPHLKILIKCTLTYNS